MKTKYPKPAEAQIRARWLWEKPLIVKATRANIRLAIRRTRNPYGICDSGRPYVQPVVGMRVETHCGAGRIVELRQPLLGEGWLSSYGPKHLDPEAKIELHAGGPPVYLFQTAMNGYTPLP